MLAKVQARNGGKTKDEGGIILTIDAMEPLKGEPSVYMARDELTNTTLGAKQLSIATKIRASLLDARINSHRSPSGHMLHQAPR
nr:hypothetical protein [Candidatus Sigynarchaeota archaeon]